MTVIVGVHARAHGSPHQRVQMFFVPLACELLGYELIILYTVFVGRGLELP